MRIFKTRWFAKFADKQGISDADLVAAIQAANAGSVDADLGGNVIKQRIARKGQGKRGGYRSIIFFKQGDRAFFVFGFAKNDQANISKTELANFKALAKSALSESDMKIEEMKAKNILTEIEHDL